MSPAEFCRDLEAYLCRKNDGHLIRIVGPVFEQVSGWAARGVPLKVAYRGIDRYFEREQRKGPRRRPIRIEFCEADILDAFDEWRRAVGLSTNAGRAPATPGALDALDATTDASAGMSANASDGEPRHARRKPGLQAHIDRVMARLTQRRVETDGTALGDVIDRVLGELDTMRAGARGARQDMRAALLARLTAIDRTLIDAARASLDSAAFDELRRDARRELEPFRSRLPPDAFQEATEAALDRLVREHCRLPSLRLDA